MRRSAIALAAAIGSALLVPAAPLADEPPAPPKAVLDAQSTSVAAGQPIELDSSASKAGTGAIVGHVWDLDGNGSFETDSGDKPKVEATPEAPGPLTVRVRVVDDRGLSSDDELDLTVVAPASMAAPDKETSKAAETAPAHRAPQPEPAAPPEAAAPPEPAGPPDPAAPPSEDPAPSEPTAPQPAAGDLPELEPLTTARMSAAPDLVPAKTLSTGTTYGATAKSAAGTTVTAAAASTGVTIKDFKFGPASVSVKVGDTITWTNQDVAPHTATASDGSFDTGSLSQGKSGSHTFTTAGTFPYICSIHPNMKGTVTVAAASGSAGGGGGDSGGTTPTPSTSGGDSGGSLPQTGLDIAVVVLLAALMMAGGAALRRTAQ
jgi:plastocyanin